MNSDKLTAQIQASGLKFSKIADMLEISRTALHNKLSGKTEFQQTEIASLKKILCLSETDFLDIFFADNVEEKST